MRIVVFDVSNGNCALVVGDNGNSIMMDCGSHSEKECPVDKILRLKKKGGCLDHMQDFNGHPLSQLVISHPDVDHISNSAKVHSHLRPASLHRRKLSEYPPEANLAINDDSFKNYKSKFCESYTAPTTTHPDWAFTSKAFKIPFTNLRSESQFDITKIKNNSSLVYVLKYAGNSIMFCGDMEAVGWDWLLENDGAFVEEISNGIDVLVASHHGHKSGYSSALMTAMGSPRLTIISKGTETGGETKVSSQYSAKSIGLNVENLNTNVIEMKYSVSTRANGAIYLDFNTNGVIDAFSEK